MYFIFEKPYQSWVDDEIDWSLWKPFQKFENGPVNYSSKNKRNGWKDCEDPSHGSTGLIVIKF